jgi:uncharacterized membrane protein YcaP (DUF421 family)
LVKDGHYIESALHREGLRKADIEVALRQQNANGPEEVAEATLTPGGAIIVWLKPQAMAARRDDLEVLRQRIDELESLLSRGARRERPPTVAPSPPVQPPPATADR